MKNTEQALTEGLMIPAYFLTPSPSSSSLESTLKQLGTALPHIELEGNVNVMAIDYTAVTQDTHKGRPEKSCHPQKYQFSASNYLPHFEFSFEHILCLGCVSERGC
jgi:hypothetical protein